MSVFLATTTLIEFCDTSDRLLLLGHRCLRPDGAAEWPRLDDELLPSAWADRERFLRAARYLDDCGELLLGRLADYLNAVHGRSCSRRYWRIVLGNWLVNYLHAAYDRYVHLGDAFARHPDLSTIALDPSCFQVPNDTFEMVGGLKNDERWNLQLISQLLVAMGYGFETRRSREIPDERRRSGIFRKTARVARGFAEDVARSLRAEGPDAVLCDIEIMDSVAAWRIALASRFRIIPVASRQAPVHVPAAFDDRRSGLGSLPAADPFERAVVTCLPYFLPTVFLEGYVATRQRALAGWRRPPRVIVSATGWNNDEVFKLFAAEGADSGSRLVAVQHGGGYGFAREWPSEDVERRLSDTFAAWGWADGPGAGLRNFPIPKLSQFCEHRRRLRGGGVSTLFVATVDKRRLTRFNSSPLGTLAEDYFDGQLRFLAALTEPMRRQMRFRPYPGVAHPLRKTIAERYGDMEWDEGGTFYQSLERTRLVVIDHPVTSMLEALAADVPTVLFWDPQRWEMRPAAEPYFEALRSAGILYDSPEAAAAHFSNVADGVQAWWRDGSVQQARRVFVDRFALVASDWRAAWLAGIGAEIAAAGVATHAMTASHYR